MIHALLLVTTLQLGWASAVPWTCDEWERMYDNSFRAERTAGIWFPVIQTLVEVHAADVTKRDSPGLWYRIDAACIQEYN